MNYKDTLQREVFSTFASFSDTKNTLKWVYSVFIHMFYII